MAGARTYTFSIIARLIIVLFLGFWLGCAGMELWFKAHNKDLPAGLSARSIMARRMAAINQAKKAGRSDYEFEVTGIQPIMR